MKIILTKDEQQFIAERADEAQLSADLLEEAYIDTLMSNFQQDIIDIAKDI